MPEQQHWNRKAKQEQNKSKTDSEVILCFIRHFKESFKENQVEIQPKKRHLEKLKVQCKPLYQKTSGNKYFLINLFISSSTGV
ncbi:hypothetical protein AQ505_22560 [Pedobacter sp. PACM 27299]|uniref:hypothetical protein n=1 Tax=Pedobacter sp. PACM 27299 TaxID=1727164 RepID=UPI000706A57C|nr:hypothetical protein [Pedobacter sp. PACM 27299]ALL08020.1 hypothetical protein AQ505_22560 [Pedobacter sp. PACM 27299]